MSQTLTDLELLALAKAVELKHSNCETALPPGGSAQVDFTARFRGVIERGDRSNRAGTNRARTAQAMIMLLVYSGVTREHSPAKLIEAWKSFGTLDKKGMAQRIASLDQNDRDLFEECMSLFQTEIVEKVPRIPTKGYVKFRGDVERG
jgi:hypothetical protein